MATSTHGPRAAASPAWAAARPPAPTARRRPGWLGGPGKNAVSGSDGLWPWLFVLPLLTGVAVFYLWPILATAYLSLTQSGPFGGSTFTGFSNFTALVKDEQLYLSLANTLLYTGIVLIGVPIAVYVASLLNLPGLRFAQFYRVLFFLPFVAMPTAIAMVWRLLFNGDFGLINRGLGLVGVDGPYWISTPTTAMIAVAIVGLWSSLGFSVIVLGAGLKNIPPELYEAAELDGASTWRQFRSVTVPLLTPSIFFVTIVTVISSFQLFDLLYAILGSSNPVLPRSLSLVYFFYREGFVNNDKGYAAAIAMVILVIIAVVTALQFRMQRRWVQDV